MLRLAFAEQGGLRLTEQGRRYAAADILRAKEQFATLVVEHAPLVRRMVRLLRHSDHGAVRADTVLGELRQLHNETDARSQLDTAIDWGRYAELFEYDVDSDRLVLPNTRTH